MDRDAQGSQEKIIPEFNRFYSTAGKNTSDEARYNVSDYFIVCFYSAIMSNVLVSNSARHFQIFLEDGGTPPIFLGMIY